jgi:hypothetical protein
VIADGVQLFATCETAPFESFDAPITHDDVGSLDRDPKAPRLAVLDCASFVETLHVGQCGIFERARSTWALDDGPSVRVASQPRLLIDRRVDGSQGRVDSGEAHGVLVPDPVYLPGADLELSRCGPTRAVPEPEAT